MNPKATSDSSLCETSSNAKTMVILLAPLMIRSVGLWEAVACISILLTTQLRCCCAGCVFG